MQLEYDDVESMHTGVAQSGDLMGPISEILVHLCVYDVIFQDHGKTVLLVVTILFHGGEIAQTAPKLSLEQAMAHHFASGGVVLETQPLFIQKHLETKLLLVKRDHNIPSDWTD
ncbi:hypothetical protein OGAPHI_002604 [Ogataea philodendri]|uniref:Uncharacterized protein n=1 Tax=Ogataea philodendri TaxID=1378263 RepID=A0A9P8PCQ5_9ASCO|nr:uncharacterized protein OGAPHI_002604 [Ogataea philodendri]KAH3668849.1 hypothetical protein OGAPHI_002604 [Ogataea philodendri]